MKAKEIIEILSKLNPDEEVWATWITKETIINSAKDYELTDEDDKLIDVETLLVNYLDLVKEITNEVDNDDYLWERFNESVDEATKNLIIELSKERTEAVEDTDLWDIEMENTNVSNS